MRASEAGRQPRTSGDLVCGCLWVQAERRAADADTAGKIDDFILVRQ